MEVGLIILYGAFLTFIFVYSLIQLNLVILYIRARKERAQEKVISSTNEADYPLVTVQLPVYNELYVVERLIDSVAKFDYPKSRFEIQVLDDSTDETADIIARKVIEKQAEGIDITHVRREGRDGFKAGALAYGMQSAKGELIAIFDADFVPVETFLKRTVAYFEDDNIGVVQTRWEHLNDNYSLLTKLQAFGLDAHFSVEQEGRNSAGYFINFNGTAGVWRKTCIEDAGGWQSDTLTEDLDLSYRAQLRGWKFKYLEDVTSPAELPVAMNALKTQQYRWTKGAAECTRKNLGKVLVKRGIGFSTKVHAIFHLLNSSIFICVFATAFLSVPLLVIKHNFPEHEILFQWATIYLNSLLVLGFFYWVSLWRDHRGMFGSLLYFLQYFPLFLSLSMGLSLHNTIAVIEGFLGRKTPFIRTPKFNLSKAGENFSGNKYLVREISLLTILEGFAALYFIGGILTGFYFGDLGMLAFHLMLSFGFGAVFYYSVAHVRQVGTSAV